MKHHIHAYISCAIWICSLQAGDLLSPIRSGYERIAGETQFAVKDTTVLLYIAARNDLAPFVERNLMQLMQIGTNERITFVVYICTAHHGKTKLTQRFIVYKNKLVQVGEDAPMDSGDPGTLVAATTWAFTHFPAQTTVLILWNHGTGDLEPHFRRAIHPSELYRYNALTQRIELNRTIGFLEYLSATDNTRGICFDNTTKHYLTNHDVGEALRYVIETHLGGKPLDILCTDACLMQGLGVIYSLCPPDKAPVAHYVIGSQEVVLATGYPYTHLFSRQAEQPMPPHQFAQHIVQAFAAVYRDLTEDYTQSAIDLFAIKPLYEKIELLAQLLIEGMNHEVRRSVRKLIATASNKNNCTSFDEPSYKDTLHFLNNLLQGLPTIQLKTQHATISLQQQLQQIIFAARDALIAAIVANATGKNLSRASGLSIYLPGETIHSSFGATDFGQGTSWNTMLRTYLQK